MKKPIIFFLLSTLCLLVGVLMSSTPDVSEDWIEDSLIIREQSTANSPSTSTNPLPTEKNQAPTSPTSPTPPDTSSELNLTKDEIVFLTKTKIKMERRKKGNKDLPRPVKQFYRFLTKNQIVYRKNIKKNTTQYLFKNKEGDYIAAKLKGLLQSETFKLFDLYSPQRIFVMMHAEKPLTSLQEQFKGLGFLVEPPQEHAPLHMGYLTTELKPFPTDLEKLDKILESIRKLDGVEYAQFMEILTMD